MRLLCVKEDIYEITERIIKGLKHFKCEKLILHTIALDTHVFNNKHSY